MRMLKTIMGAAVAAAMFAPAAQASHIPGLGFNGQLFTVNPTAVGEAQGPFQTRFINFGYQAEADQTGTAFTETGIASFGDFRLNLGGPPQNSGITGLNSTYNLYLAFSGAGTVAPSGSGGVDGTFATFNLTMFVDRNSDTTFNTPAPGAPNESKVVTGGSGDDVSVLTGTLQIGGFHINSGLAAGDFDVQFTVTSCGAASGFFCGPGGIGVGSTGDLNGNNQSIVGAVAPGGTAIDIIIDGSGNEFFQAVPEPGSLALGGLGAMLLSLVGFRRNRKSS
jgi:hypothetical protein